jgi:hypothetical protein
VIGILGVDVFVRHANLSLLVGLTHMLGGGFFL